MKRVDALFHLLCEGRVSGVLAQLSAVDRCSDPRGALSVGFLSERHILERMARRHARRKIQFQRLHN